MPSGIPIPKDAVRPPETVLVNIASQETRVAVLEENNICELHIEHGSGHSLVGNICLGMVRHMLPEMQNTFIDISLECAAFLHIVDVLRRRRNPDETQCIEHMLLEGQSALMQVIKDPINTKGAHLSAQIPLAGRFLVHLPQEDHIGISQHIKDDTERNSLCRRLTSLLSRDACHGHIIRTNVENATDEQLQSDIHYLIRMWEYIQERAKIQPPGTLLYQDLPLGLRVLRDMFGLDMRRIPVDSTESYRRATRFTKQYVHGALGRIELFKGERPLFEAYSVGQEVSRALQPRVNLNFGSYLTVESAEAMVTIDVNAGGFVSVRNSDGVIFRTNLEACHIIVCGLRLYDLGGIIIIDFINMTQEAHREAMLQELVKAPVFGHTRVTLDGLTSLDLAELTRKRSRENLSRALCESCLLCQGRGRLKMPQTIYYEAQREVVREARHYGVQSLRVLAAPNVIDLLLDEEPQSLAMLINFIGKPISPAVETTYAQE